MALWVQAASDSIARIAQDRETTDWYISDKSPFDWLTVWPADMQMDCLNWKLSHWLTELFISWITFWTSCLAALQLFTHWKICAPHQLYYLMAEQLTDWQIGLLSDWLLVDLLTGCRANQFQGERQNWAQLAEGTLITTKSRRPTCFGCRSRFLAFFRMPITFRPSCWPTDENEAYSVLFQCNSPQGWKLDRRGSNGAVDFVVIKKDKDWSC